MFTVNDLALRGAVAVALQCAAINSSIVSVQSAKPQLEKSTALKGALLDH